MKYKGGRFSKERYQQRENKLVPEPDQVITLFILIIQQHLINLLSQKFI